MRIFDGSSIAADTDAFARWISDHPRSYYVNVLDQRNGRLLAAQCSHIFPPTAGMNLVRRAKWASDRREELRQAAQEQGLELLSCQTCGA